MQIKEAKVNAEKVFPLKMIFSNSFLASPSTLTPTGFAIL